MEPTETDILAVARAMVDAIPIELPTQPLPESDAVKEPPTAKARTMTAEQPTEWEEIRPRIEHRISTQPRELQRQIGPSELGTRCVHCLAAKLAGWPERSQPGWLPFVGTCVHAMFEQWFDGTDDMVTVSPEGEKRKRFEAEKRVTVGRLQGLDGGYDVSGSIDLYDRRNDCTIDWKIVGNTTATKVKAHGPSQQYRVQASLYGIGLENAGERCRRSCIYFMPRNKPSLSSTFAWEQDFDPQPGRWALARAQLLVNLMDCIETACGADVRDSWIKQLPRAEDECFQCRGQVWPDMSPLPEFDEHPWPDVPDRWLAMIPLIDSEYPNNNN